MQYRINVAKREQIRMRYNVMDYTYRHYFKIITDNSFVDVMQLVAEMQEKYPAPEYNVTLYRETSYSEQVDLKEQETA